MKDVVYLEETKLTVTYCNIFFLVIIYLVGIFDIRNNLSFDIAVLALFGIFVLMPSYRTIHGVVLPDGSVKKFGE